MVGRFQRPAAGNRPKPQPITVAVSLRDSYARHSALAGMFGKQMLYHCATLALCQPPLAVFFSFVSLYYYLIVIKEMYLGKPEEPRRFPTPWLDAGVPGWKANYARAVLR